MKIELEKFAGGNKKEQGSNFTLYVNEQTAKSVNPSNLSYRETSNKLQKTKLCFDGQ